MVNNLEVGIYAPIQWMYCKYDGHKEWVIFYMKSRAHYTIATYTNTIVHTSAMMGMERRNEFFPAL